MKLALALACSCLLRAALAVRVPIMVEQAVYPYVPVKIGTPPSMNYLAFDAGSAILWTNALGDNFTREGEMENGKPWPEKYNPATSSTAKYQGRNNTFVYGGPSVMTGPLYTDLVTLKSSLQACARPRSLDNADA